MSRLARRKELMALLAWRAAVEDMAYAEAVMRRACGSLLHGDLKRAFRMWRDVNEEAGNDKAAVVMPSPPVCHEYHRWV